MTVAISPPVRSHSLLADLTEDDHLQYLTDGRFDTRFGSKTLTDLLNASAGDLDSGTLLDARVSQSNVTQHQAALSITESQISDFGSYLPLTGGTLSGVLTATTLVSNGNVFANGQLVVSNTVPSIFFKDTDIVDKDVRLFVNSGRLFLRSINDDETVVTTPWDIDTTAPTNTFVMGSNGLATFNQGLRVSAGTTTILDVMNVSGATTFTGTTTISAASPKLDFFDSNTTDKNVRLFCNVGFFTIRNYNDADNTETIPVTLDSNAPANSLYMTALGRVGIQAGSSPDYDLEVGGSIGFAPGSSVTPADNGDVVFELTNNTTFTVKAKGSDGVVRSGTITLS